VISCFQCAEKQSQGQGHPKCPSGHVCGSVSEVIGLTSEIQCACCQESHDMVLGYIMVRRVTALVHLGQVEEANALLGEQA
jgi:hypothetical protein